LQPNVDHSRQRRQRDGRGEPSDGQNGAGAQWAEHRLRGRGKDDNIDGQQKDQREDRAMATEKTDVVIVGLGAAGGVLAAELAKAGMKVVGL
jgi:NADPH-dependent 2,4-dienoyl-CoA reductase/sulfur reductase-like enzyme